MRKFLNNKKQLIFLIAAFMSGFSVMVVELVAARVITPFVGSSVYTWTSVIGMVLLGLSIGSYLGGYLIDKYKSTKTLSWFFFLSSFSVCLIPFILKYISYFVLIDFSILSRVLLISLVLFLLPSVFLGCLYPSILKLYSKEIEHLGKKSGTISCLWSLGSISGTFLTGFYLVGAIGSSNIFFMIAGILFLLAFLFFVSSKQRTYKRFALFLALTTLILTNFCFIGARDENKKIIFNSESDYYKIAVVRGAVAGEVFKILFLDFGTHSAERIDGEDMDAYTAIYPVFSVFKNEIKDIFAIGGGSYTIAKNFSEFYENSNITVSEIDPEVTKTAEDFFDLAQYPIKTVIGDARVFLNENQTKYDIIFGDAYNSFISVPWHLTTYEFNELAKARLKEDGLYAVNFISAIEGENAAFFESMLATFKKTFNNFYIFAYGVERSVPQNIVLIGVNSENEISHSELIKKVIKIKNGKRLFYKIISKDSLKNAQQPQILTDNFAPVEKLMMPLINNHFNPYAKFFYSFTSLN